MRAARLLDIVVMVGCFGALIALILVLIGVTQEHDAGLRLPKPKTAIPYRWNEPTLKASRPGYGRARRAKR